jgi:signal transduction histidine kinase
VLAAGASIVVAVAVFAIATIVIVRRELGSSLDSALRQRAQDVAQLAVSAPAVLQDPGGLESPVSGRQIVVQVADAHGRIIARSLTLGARLLPEDQLTRQALVSGRTGFENIHIGGREFRLYAAPIADAGGPAAGGVVLVASDTTDITDTLHHLGVVLTLTGIGVALVAVLAAAALTARGLRPLRRLAAGAGEIERTADPAQRLPEPTTADEIGALTGVLNRMLASLEDARAVERRFLADASHELRTPVTTVLGNVEYVSRHGLDPEVLADLRRDSARLARLVDDLLVLERAGAAGPALEPVALDVLARETADQHEQADGRVRLGAIEPVEVRADEASIRRAVENLIENALVHGPPGGEVDLTVARRDGRALLTVSDHGDGPDPADAEHLFERFWRGPDAYDRPGSGLGLSIVATIVERHGGKVTVAGSSFTVDLPAVR